MIVTIRIGRNEREKSLKVSTVKQKVTPKQFELTIPQIKIDIQLYSKKRKTHQSLWKFPKNNCFTILFLWNKKLFKREKKILRIFFLFLCCSHTNQVILCQKIYYFGVLCQFQWNLWKKFWFLVKFNEFSLMIREKIVKWDRKEKMTIDKRENERKCRNESG